MNSDVCISSVQNTSTCLFTCLAGPFTTQIVLSLTTLSLLIVTHGCIDTRDRGEIKRELSTAILDDTAARESAKEAFNWLSERTEIMVKHKSDCILMADQLIEHHKDTQSKLQAWRDASAQEWMEARSLVDSSYKSKLTQMIARGDIVYSFCSFFQTFRERLNKGLTAIEPEL